MRTAAACNGNDKRNTPIFADDFNSSWLPHFVDITLLLGLIDALHCADYGYADIIEMFIEQ